MRKLTIDGKEYPIYGSGATILIYMDDLNTDFLTDVQDLFVSVAKGKLPRYTTVSRLVYALIKTANPDAVDTYREWIRGVSHIGCFTSDVVLRDLMSELNDAMATGDEPAEANASKKK